MRPPLFEIDRFEDRLAAVHDDLPRQVIRDEPQLLDKRLGTLVVLPAAVSWAYIRMLVSTKYLSLMELIAGLGRRPLQI